MAGGASLGASKAMSLASLLEDDTEDEDFANTEEAKAMLSRLLDEAPQAAPGAFPAPRTALAAAARLRMQQTQHRALLGPLLPPGQARAMTVQSKEAALPMLESPQLSSLQSQNPMQGRPQQANGVHRFFELARLPPHLAARVKALTTEQQQACIKITQQWVLRELKRGGRFRSQEFNTRLQLVVTQVLEKLENGGIQGKASASAGIRKAEKETVVSGGNGVSPAAPPMPNANAGGTEPPSTQAVSSLNKGKSVMPRVNGLGRDVLSPAVANGGSARATAAHRAIQWSKGAPNVRYNGRIPEPKSGGSASGQAAPRVDGASSSKAEWSGAKGKNLTVGVNGIGTIFSPRLDRFLKDRLPEVSYNVFKKVRENQALEPGAVEEGLLLMQLEEICGPLCWPEVEAFLKKRGDDYAPNLEHTKDKPIASVFRQSVLKRRSEELAEEKNGSAPLGGASPMSAPPGAPPGQPGSPKAPRPHPSAEAPLGAPPRGFAPPATGASAVKMGDPCAPQPEPTNVDKENVQKRQRTEVADEKRKEELSVCAICAEEWGEEHRRIAIVPKRPFKCGHALYCSKCLKAFFDSKRKNAPKGKHRYRCPSNCDLGTKMPMLMEIYIGG